ncbi:MAG TPA: sigma-70 family RNA polymerase sigma factor, partial [Verrucomicrobiae bacterium]|nr:sigma-70 family RNA polymerase sigma factor [Verrucomicrobiae bacterium]
DAHLAQDVAQAVFTDLARKAGSLARRESLAGWLYTSAHFAAAKIARTENRRRDREEKFMREPTNESSAGVSPAQTSPEPDWEKIRPALDDAMHELQENDREAILLRYFENRPFAEVGARFGLNENATRMRVERALEKLRAVFTKHGITTATALASVLSANAVQMAPAGLAATLATTSLAAAGTGTAFAILKIMTATQLKLGIGALVVAGAATAMVVRHQSQTRLRDENESLHQKVTQLQANNESLSNRLTSVGQAKSLTDEQLNELMKLRGEIGVMQRQLDELGKLRGENQQLREAETKLQASNENMAMASALAKFKANEVQVVNTMKQLGVAERIYGNDNNGQYATNFEQMTNVLGGLYKKPLLDNIEFVNAGAAREQYPQMIIFRERNPRQSPDGTWQRVYGLADGSVQVAVSPDGNFGAWEKYDYNEKGIILSQPPDPNQ